ncbi:MAG: hypothetical protein ACREJD_16470 [Phycisphaerales bacterium]
MKFRHSIFLCFALCAIVAYSLSAPAKSAPPCLGDWQDSPAHAFPGVDGPVFASILWDPDGDGPLPPQLVIGGKFTSAGGVPAGCLAACDPVTFEWHALAPPITHTSTTPAVYSFATLPNPAGGFDLLVGGLFTSAGAVPAASIARWDGLSWSSMSDGVKGAVRAIHVSKSPQDQTEIYIGGNFIASGPRALHYLARWDGANWVEHGGQGSPTDTVIYAIARLPGGDLVVGGFFTSFGGSGSGGLARWNGSSWVAMASGASNAVYSLLVLADGSLIIGGAFTTFDGQAINRIARWNGSSWIAMGSGIVRSSDPFDGANVWALTQLPSGEIVAAGYFLSAGGALVSNIALWNGTTWQPLGFGLFGVEYKSVYTLSVLPSGAVFAGGDFTEAGPGSARGLAIWRDHAWAVPAAGLNGQVFAIAYDGANGGEWLAGNFSSAGAYPASNIVYNASNGFQPLGEGLDSPALCMTQDSSGGLIVGGEFSHAGGSSAPHLARWNGTTWSPFEGGTDGSVRCISSLPGNAIVVGGSFNHAGAVPAVSIALWTGSEWLPLGPTITGSVYAILASAPNDIVIGGEFSVVGNPAVANIAKWNGDSWSALGTGLDGPVFALARSLDGDILAGGEFDHSGMLNCNRVARWSVNAWHSLDSGVLGGSVNSISVLRSGEVIASGSFAIAGGKPARRIARWSIGAWTSFGSGFDAPVFASTVLPSQDLLVGGAFSTIDQHSSAFWARLSRAACCPSDLNMDGLVDDGDFLLFLAQYNILDCAAPEMPVSCPADFNRDSVVDDADFGIFVPAYNELLCP